MLLDSKNKKNSAAANNKKTKFIMLGVVAAIIVLCAAAVAASIGSAQNNEQKPVWDELPISEKINGLTGYSRTVTREEYEFYRELVRQNAASDVSEAELDKAAKTYIDEVSAKFYLGSKLNICEVYSFDAMKLRMEMENTDRKVKKAEGEVFYGPTEFTLETYFKYIYSNLESDLLRYLVSNADEEIISQAKKYYDGNPDAFTNVSSVTYRSTQNGAVTEKTIQRDEFKNMQKTDSELMDFFSNAEVGSKATVGSGETEAEVEVLNIGYETMDFEENSAEIVQYFIEEKLMPGYLSLIAENNPLVYEQ